MSAGESDEGSQATQRIFQYAAVVAGVLVTALLRSQLTPIIGDRALYLLFVPVVLLSALYAGVAAGALALTLASLMAFLVLGSNVHIPIADRIDDQISLALFVIVGVGILALARRERLEKRLRISAEANLEALNGLLEERVEERTAQLRAANRELEGFCYAVAHDLRTPMRAIAGNARILLEDHGATLGEPLKDKLVRMEAAATKLGQLVEGLLTYARLASTEMQLEQFDLGKLARDLAKTVEREEGVKLHLTTEGDLHVRADIKMVRVALVALLKNSARYRKPGEDAFVEISRRDGSILVTDQGIGFDMAYLDKIFLPFERLHRDEEYAGVGMGLALVRRIVERHHGSIAAVSESGAGAKFIFDLGPGTTSERPASPTRS